MNKKRSLALSAVATVFAVACLPVTASAQPAPVEGRDYKIFKDSKSGLTNIKIGPKANVQTRQLAEQLGIRMFDIRRDNPTKTLALCETSPSHFKTGRTVGLNPRADESAWVGCPETGQYVYLVPGETLVLTGVHHESPADQKKILDTVKELKACTDLECQTSKAKALGVTLKTAPAAPVSAARPQDPKPQATATPTLEPSASAKADTQPVPAPKTEPRVEEGVSFLILSLVALGVASLFLFLGFVLGRRGRQSVVENRLMPPRFADIPLPAVSPLPSVGTDDDVDSSDRTTSKSSTSLMDARLKEMEAERNSATIENQELNRRIGLLEPENTSLKAKVEKLEQVTQELENQATAILTTLDIPMDFGPQGLKMRLSNASVKLKQWKEVVRQAELARQRFWTQLGASGDMPSLDTVIVRLLKKVEDDACANALSDAPTNIPMISGDSDELRNRREEMLAAEALMVEALLERSIVIPAEKSLPALFNAVYAHCCDGERDFKDLQSALNSQAEERGVSFTDELSAIQRAEQLHVEHLRMLNEQRSFITALSDMIAWEVEKFQIAMDPSTPPDQVLRLALDQYRGMHQKITSCPDLGRRVEQLSRILKEFDAEVPLPGHDELRRDRAIVMLKELASACEELETVMFDLTGVQIHSEGLLYVHHREYALQAQRTQYLDGITNNVNMLGSSVANTTRVSPSIPPPAPQNYHEEPTKLMDPGKLQEELEALKNAQITPPNGNSLVTTKSFRRDTARNFPPPDETIVEQEVMEFNHPFLTAMDELVHGPRPVLKDEQTYRRAEYLINQVLAKPVSIERSSIPTTGWSEELIKSLLDGATLGALSRIQKKLGLPTWKNGQTTQRPPEF